MKNPRPITIVNNIKMATIDPNARFYRLGMFHGMQSFIPITDKDTMVACLVDGLILNVPREKAFACFSVNLIKNGPKCECGKEKHNFTAHSTWCPKFP